jgi:hypothetical protein
MTERTLRAAAAAATLLAGTALASRPCPRIGGRSSTSFDGALVPKGSAGASGVDLCLFAARSPG